MKVSRDKLLAALKDVGAVIKTRTTLPILETVKMETVQGVLTVTCTDLYSRIARKVECDGELAGFCVSHKKVEQLVSSANAEEISISQNGRAIFEIPARCWLPATPALEFPAASTSAFKAFGVAPEILAEAIERVAWLRGGIGDPRVFVHGVSVDCDATCLTAVTTSGSVIAIYSTASIQAEAKFLLPHDLAGALLNELNSPSCIVSLSDSEIKATSDFGETIIRLIDGKSAGIKPFQEQSKKLEYASIERDKLLSACESILAIAGSTTVEAAWTKLVAKDGQLTIDYSAHGGEFKDTTPLNIKDFGITIDASKLITALKNVGPSIKIATSKRAMFISDGDLTVILAGHT